jgi:hypothetical protein
MKNLQDLQLGPLLAVDEAPTEEPPSWMALQPEPPLAVEAPAEERPRLLVGERPGPRHPLPRARPWARAAVLPELHRPVQKMNPEMSISRRTLCRIVFVRLGRAGR